MSIVYALAFAGLGAFIGFSVGALYGISTGKRAGKVEGWVAANRELLQRVRNSADILNLPLIREKTKVLVIEDNDDAREILEAVLKMYGYEVTGAGTGREGIEAARLFNPTSIIVDIMLPDINGIIVARELQRELPAVNLIALSGMEQEIDEIDDAGFKAYVKKPYDINHVIKAIDQS